MKTIRLTIDLEYNDKVEHGDDKLAEDWFVSKVLGGEMILYSEFMDDEIGKVTIVSH